MMKNLLCISGLFILLLLGSCKESATKGTASAVYNPTLATSDSSDKAAKQEQASTIASNVRIGNKTLSQYLNDPKIPTLFKTTFEGRTDVRVEEKCLDIIDSLFSNDRERQAFYFVLLTRTMYQADGAYSEPLGIATKDYVEKQTVQFLKYFKTEKVLTDKDFTKWAESVAGEIGISSEGEEQQEIDRLQKKMLKTCPNEEQQINSFIEKLKKYIFS